jgi:hypothetical protein
VNLKTDSHPKKKSSPAPGTGDEMLTKRELAAKLKVTVRTVEKWKSAGVLPHIKISQVVLFHWADVIDHLRANFRVPGRVDINANNFFGKSGGTHQ